MDDTTHKGAKKLKIIRKKAQHLAGLAFGTYDLWIVRCVLYLCATPSALNSSCSKIEAKCIVRRFG